MPSRALRPRPRYAQGCGKSCQPQSDAEDPESSSRRCVAVGLTHEPRQSLAFDRKVDDADHYENQAGRPRRHCR
jgi:hypothetical protein